MCHPTPYRHEMQLFPGSVARTGVEQNSPEQYTDQRDYRQRPRASARMAGFLAPQLKYRGRGKVPVEQRYTRYKADEARRATLPPSALDNCTSLFRRPQAITRETIQSRSVRLRSHCTGGLLLSHTKLSHDVSESKEPAPVRPQRFHGAAPPDAPSGTSEVPEIQPAPNRHTSVRCSFHLSPPRHIPERAAPNEGLGGQA